jgi:ribosome maturation factor RimP
MVGIFRTNINTLQDKNKVIGEIQANFSVVACSVDIEDCDRVLRIVSPQLGEDAIIAFVQRLGYYCDLLD